MIRITYRLRPETVVKEIREQDLYLWGYEDCTPDEIRQTEANVLEEDIDIFMEMFQCGVDVYVERIEEG